MLSTPRLGDRLHFAICGVAAVGSRRSPPPAIVVEKLVGKHLGHRVPVTGRKGALNARTLGSPRFPAAARRLGRRTRERGVEVVVVEDFAAADQRHRHTS